MLPAAARVRRSSDFAAVLKRGHRARRGSVVVHAGRRFPPGEDGARVGFIVSKAVGSAVTRNLVKRRLRGVAASHRENWPTDTDIVIRALPEAATTNFHRLEADVTGALTTILRRYS